MSGNFPTATPEPQSQLTSSPFQGLHCSYSHITHILPVLTYMSSISNLTVALFNSCAADNAHSHSPHQCDKLCSPTNQRTGSPEQIKTLQFQTLMCIHSTKKQYSNNAFCQAVPWRLPALSALAGHNLLADLATGITSSHSVSLHHCMAGTPVQLHTHWYQTVHSMHFQSSRSGTVVHSHITSLSERCNVTVTLKATHQKPLHVLFCNPLYNWQSLLEHSSK